MKTLKNVKDLTGERFGRLTVIGLHQTETRKTYWECQCDCGNKKVVRSDSLQCGAIRSCGCLKKEQDKQNLWSSEAKKKYLANGGKFSGTRLYEIWKGMKSRCYYEKDSRYSRYGGRGIAMCDEWRKDFLAFREWALNNGYSETLTIDRIDNDGNYCPENCRWATIKEQCRNRSSNIKIKIGSEEKTFTEWCEIFGVDYKRALGRYHRGKRKTIEELFT